jgi:putative membrane protein
MLDREHSLARPKTPRQFLRLYLTGFAMGAADIVPGVSGGTMAFILGIYNDLLNAIKSFDVTALRLALRLRLREALAHIPLAFLIAVGLGIFTAIVVLSGALSHLLETHPTFVFAFFGGLILASIVAVGAKIRWSLATLAALIAGAAAAFIIVGLPVLQNANHDPLTLFISGAIAICAMILPGISGSFILLILGQYQYVLNAVRDRDILTLVAVAAGCVVGIVIFSRVLSYLLRRHYQVTIAALTGFMVGSLRTIWERSSAGAAALPDFGLGEALLGLALVIAGFLLVSALDHAQSRDNPFMGLFWRSPKADSAESLAGD